MAEEDKPHTSTKQRRSAPGRIDPDYARELLEKSGKSNNEDDRAFLSEPRAGEELAEHLGENFVAGATSGEDPEPERQDRMTEAELGGPYVTSPAEAEFARGTDEMNPPDADVEPFPKT
jgi:hypothetical protein